MFYSASPSKLNSTVVFIDCGVQGYLTLAEGINRDTDVYVLNQESDAIEQIRNALASYESLESVHLISHGVPGCLYLGHTQLSLSNLEHYRPLLQRWFNVSNQHRPPSLAIYGCNAAAGDAGEEFFTKLRQITGAQLYGTTQKVGNPNQGGTWQLSPQADSASNLIPQVPLNQRMLATYPGTFAPQTFEEYGVVSTKIENIFASPNGLFFDDNGKLIVGGNFSQDSILIRRNSDGSIDESFADNGTLTINNLRRASLIPSTDNKFILIGANDFFSTTFRASRYNNNGTLDTTFGTNGELEVNLASFFSTGFGNSVDFTTDASGRIVAVGSLNGDIAIARLNTDGSLDSSFGTSGFTLTDFGGSFEVPQTVRVDSDGKLVVGGHASNGSTNDFLLVRYNSDGSLDTTFGTAGRTLTDFGGTNDTRAQLTIDGNGKLLLGGRATDAATENDDFALARYNSDGSLDSSFGTNGIVRTDLGGAEYGQGVVEVAGGKLIQAGDRVTTRPSGGGTAFDYQPIFLQYNSDGSLDSGFGNNGVGQGMGGPLAVDANGKLFGASSLFDVTGAALTVVSYDDALKNTETFLSWQTDSSANDFGQVSAVSLSPIGAFSTALGRSITDTSWQFQTTGDFNGDGQEDAVLRQFGGSNQVLLWTLNSDGTAIASEKFIGRPIEDPNWSIKGAADFNNDGNTDLLVRNANADQNVVWYLDAQQNIVSEELIGRGFQDNNWKIIATNDFNADGEADILLRNDLSAQLLVWQLNGNQIETEYLAGRVISDTSWRVEGSRDFNNDGHADLFVRNAAIQRSFLWLMQNGQIQHEIPVSGVPLGGAQLLM